MEKFNRGDKVRLVGAFWNNEWYKAQDRDRRKAIAWFSGKVCRVDIADMGEWSDMYAGHIDVKHGTGKRRRYCHAPREMFEAVEKGESMTTYSYLIVDAVINGKMKYAVHHMKHDEHGDTTINCGRWVDSKEEAQAQIDMYTEACEKE